MENDSSRACLGKTQGSNASSFLTGETDRAHEPTKIFEACRQNGAFVEFFATQTQQFAKTGSG